MMATFATPLAAFAVLVRLQRTRTANAATGPRASGSPMGRASAGRTGGGPGLIAGLNRVESCNGLEPPAQVMSRVRERWSRCPATEDSRGPRR
jgi:hypothetical protein